MLQGNLAVCQLHKRPVSGPGFKGTRCSPRVSTQMAVLQGAKTFQLSHEVKPTDVFYKNLWMSPESPKSMWFPSFWVRSRYEPSDHDAASLANILNVRCTVPRTFLKRCLHANRTSLHRLTPQCLRPFSELHPYCKHVICPYLLPHCVAMLAVKQCPSAAPLYIFSQIAAFPYKHAYKNSCCERGPDQLITADHDAILVI